MKNLVPVPSGWPRTRLAPGFWRTALPSSYVFCAKTWPFPRALPRHGRDWINLASWTTTARRAMLTHPDLLAAALINAVPGCSRGASRALSTLR